MHLRPVIWRDGHLIIIDQTLLPAECREIRLASLESVREAICTLRVRGAPAIGVCAAFGLLVALDEAGPANLAGGLQVLDAAAERLGSSRPTAVNLFWALRRMQNAAQRIAAQTASLREWRERLESEACALRDEDTACCQRIGDYGATLIPEGAGVLTHCNAGALATSAYGTALAAMYRAHEAGRTFHVFVDETRPLLQGARLTAWELLRAGIEVTLICDNTAAQVMREGRVQLVISGADRIAANGDTANKIGTYGLADLAYAHGRDHIPIEQRAGEEVTHTFGRPTAPEGVAVYNPAFDVTPARYIAGLVTEQGILMPPFEEAIRDCFENRAETP